MAGGLPKQLWFIPLAMLIALLVFALVKALVRTLIVVVMCAVLIALAQGLFPEQSAQVRTVLKERLESMFRDSASRAIGSTATELGAQSGDGQ